MPFVDVKPLVDPRFRTPNVILPLSIPLLMPKERRRSPGFHCRLPANYVPTAGRDGVTLDARIMEAWGACRKCNRFGHFAKNCGAPSRIEHRKHQRASASSFELTPEALRAARLARFQPDTALSPQMEPEEARCTSHAIPIPGPTSTAAQAGLLICPMPALLAADLKVGMRLRIWWDGDEVWYVGEVKSVSRSRGICIAFDKVAGEDDKTEYYSLKELDEQRWELFGAEAAPQQPVSAATAAATAAYRAPAAPQAATVPADTATATATTTATATATATAPPRVETKAGVLCIICCEAEIALMFQPCGHICCCSECVRVCEMSSDERLCPICRQSYDAERTTAARLAGIY